jgi:pimeloyl-ACP methyl ester carboxylesterase
VGFVEAFGLPRPPAETVARQDARALAASSSERSPAEAQIPLDVLADAPFPTLVVSGGFENISEEAQRVAGRAFGAVCDVLERRLGAERLRVPGTGHAPQQAGAAFNDPLRAFLRRASARKGP